MDIAFNQIPIEQAEQANLCAIAAMAEGKKEEEGWKRVQKKTFTRWCNSYLRRRKNGPGGEGILVEDLYADLEDGFRLNNLLQIISNGGGDKNDPDKAKFKVRSR